MLSPVGENAVMVLFGGRGQSFQGMFSNSGSQTVPSEVIEAGSLSEVWKSGL